MRNRFLAVAALLLALGTCAYALNPSLDISQYAHNSWTISQGFCKGLIRAMAQTPDGYLWVGSEFGLVRFDGVRCVPWPPPTHQQLSNTYIDSLVATRDGTLWIGTHGGLASLKKGKLTEYPEFAGQEVGPLLEDREGTVWVGTGHQSLVGKLCAVRGNSVHCYADSRFGNGVFSLYEDSGGELWVAAVNGLWRWKPGPPKLYPMPDRVLAFTELDNGALLAVMRGGIVQLAAGRVEPFTLPEVAGLLDNVLRDRDGGLWIVGQYGLLHVHQGRTDMFSKSDGLSGDNILALLEDREGNIWAATENGLDRFRDLAVVTVSAKQGFYDTNHTDAVLGASDGSIWVGTLDRLNRWKHGQITVYRRSHKGSSRPSEPVVNGGLTHEITDTALPDEIAGPLFEDHSGRIWVSTVLRLIYFENNHFVALGRTACSEFIHSMADDGAGGIWISANRFLCRLRNGSVPQQIPWVNLGGKGFAETLLSDPVRGGLWLGFFKGGVAFFKDNQIRASYATIDGLTEGRVNSLRLDRDGALWAATTGGLSRLKDGHITTLTRKNGLPCDSLDWAIEDDAHSLWLNMACGLVRIARPELDTWIADSKRAVQVTVFDSSDGVKSHAFYLSTTPHVAKSSDGRIWFSTWQGLSVFDPQHIPANKLPAPVHIEQVIADGKTYWQNLDETSLDVRLPQRPRNLEIDYTALSFAAPEKNRFKYKLEGYDPEWIDAGNRRQAFYTNLPPRKYRFRVVASNNSGVWNEAGAPLEFSIDPAYYQTNWFLAVCAAAFVAFLWMLYRMRVEELKREERKLREAIETIPTMAWMAEADGTNAFVNRQWVEFTGRSPQGTAGGGWQAIVHPEDLDGYVRRWGASVSSGERFEEEVRFRRADGKYHWFLSRAVPLRDKRGKIQKWYGVSTDIEDRKRAEQLQSDLAHLNRVSTVGELAASISHELKQPITAAITSANAALRWLQREQPDISRACDTTKRIVKDGTRAAEIIDRLRSLYRKSPPQRQLVEVNESIGDVVALLRGEANRYGVSIRMDVTADVPKILADRVQLQQVLMNIMLNGIESMNETGGVLTVKSRVEYGNVTISVSDTGVGLPRENADRIFDAFFTTKSQGSGMGLAISRNIIESHGGRLWATPNDGLGASFHLSLPTETKTAERPGVGASRLA